METRTVRFVKDGVSFGQSMLTLNGQIEFEGNDPHEDFPSPLPHLNVYVIIIDDDKNIVYESKDWNSISYFLDGHDQSMINASQDTLGSEAVMLEFGHG